MLVQASQSPRLAKPNTPSAPPLLVASDRSRDTFGPIPTVRALACNTGMHGVLREPRRLALLRQGDDPDVVATVVRDNLRFASTDDEAAFTKRIRAAAREAGVSPIAIERTTNRVLRDVESIIVERTMHAPMARALTRGLTLRNTELERVANDPSSTRDAATTARWHMRENDVLIHALERGELHGDLYGICPELTRETIATRDVGLSSDSYPFSGAHAHTFAQAAVLREARDAQPLDGKVAMLLTRAARATRDAPPDTLELMEATCR